MSVALLLAVLSQLPAGQATVPGRAGSAASPGERLSTARGTQRAQGLCLLLPTVSPASASSEPSRLTWTHGLPQSGPWSQGFWLGLVNGESSKRPARASWEAPERDPIPGRWSSSLGPSPLCPQVPTMDSLCPARAVWRALCITLFSNRPASCPAPSGHPGHSPLLPGS